MKLWKLTNQKHQTHGGCQWGENVTHTASGEGDLCGPGWVHAYTDPLLAVLLNPIHADISNPVLWECEGEVGKSNHGLKVGCTTLTTLRQVSLPVISDEQHIRFGIGCAATACSAPTWRTWAANWLDGTDRSEAAAQAAAWSAWPTWAALAAGWAAEAAAWAAQAAARGGWSAWGGWSAVEIDIDLVGIAHWAMDVTLTDLPAVVKAASAAGGGRNE